MGCNCATQEQIRKLHELYGGKSSLDKPFKQKIGELFKNFLIYFILFIISPILISFVIYKVVFTKDKKISVRRLLKFNSNGLDEALATNIIENTNIVKSE